MAEESKWRVLANEEKIQKTIEALSRNGINALVVDGGEEAKSKVLEIIPENASVMAMTSMTLEELGVSKEINESGKYDSVRKRLSEMDKEKDGKEMLALGAAPDCAVGSVHAVTEEGQVVIASNTASQLLIINEEIQASRITLIFVKENLGF